MGQRKHDGADLAAGRVSVGLPFFSFRLDAVVGVAAETNGAARA